MSNYILSTAIKFDCPDCDGLLTLSHFGEDFCPICHFRFCVVTDLDDPVRLRIVRYGLSAQNQESVIGAFYKKLLRCISR